MAETLSAGLAEICGSGQGRGERAGGEADAGRLFRDRIITL